MAAACNRADTDREAREAAAELRTAASAAGERLADGWLTTKVQAQFFADDDIKARYIDVTTRDGVVTIKGHVENEQVRQQVLQIAKNTDGVRQVQDQLLVGQPANVFETGDQPVATGGSADGALGPNTAAPPVLDDSAIATSIQAKYFRDSGIKARDIAVESRNGVVTLRGRVASDSERAQALILARMTEGVQRVEDALTVDASLALPSATGTAGAQPVPSTPITPSTQAAPATPNGQTAAGSAVPSPAAPAAAAAPDTSAESRIRQQLSTDARLKGHQIDVSVKAGVALIQGTVPDQASKQRVLTIVRQSEGVVQVVDRITVARK